MRGLEFRQLVIQYLSYSVAQLLSCSVTQLLRLAFLLAKIHHPPFVMDKLQVLKFYLFFLCAICDLH